MFVRSFVSVWHQCVQLHIQAIFEAATMPLLASSILGRQLEVAQERPKQSEDGFPNSVQYQQFQAMSATRKTTNDTAYKFNRTIAIIV